MSLNLPHHAGISPGGFRSICAAVTLLILTLLPWTNAVFAQQIDIPRVELMPNMPQPYQMRDWKRAALEYDSLIFDLNLNGEYLPVIWVNPNTVNYPEHESFGLHSYVGTFSPNNGEAINVMAAVIGATLAGIDKSDQSGFDWVLMCEEYFNRRPEENIYLNQPISASGEDWWYDSMPNIFFYQLNDLYPGTGDFENQFTIVADRWMAAVEAMGGSAAPWHKAYMNYRGWHFESMTPNQNGVPEPEAAGAIAWLLYHAYLNTGEEDYRMAAEWALEFLNDWNTNPSYELQLPYGVYAAARMNAELGTDYDIEKMLNWCFDVGPLRQWGVITGNWGGYDCYGLVGEALGDGHYAFAMNGFEQAGALVPMVRFDDRFARAIGKWVLNLANASRLFYSQYLPDNHQDNEEWAGEHDPHASIAYEGLRENWFGTSPYATGDAIGGGWAETNLALYGSSHVGILAGIIDTTEVEMILQLDVLKTAFYGVESFPTYLYFNPYSDDVDILVEAPIGNYDVYDLITNDFLLKGVSGPTPLTIPGDGAVLASFVPAGGMITYELDKMSIDGIVVDYRSGQAIDNYPPRIKALASALQTVSVGEQTAFFCTAVDRDSDPLSYDWSTSGGAISGEGSEIAWIAPDLAGEYIISANVEDGEGGVDSASATILVIDNHIPAITSIIASPEIIPPGETTLLTCIATDQDGDSLNYAWTAGFGSIEGSGATVTWTGPSGSGYFYVTCTVTDSMAQVTDSVGISVGDLVISYLFNGNAVDESGFENHGIVGGATAVPDRFGNANSAFYFDGENDFVRIPNHPSLNFAAAITVSFWMEMDETPEVEAYPLSHGNWENRWKISITDQRVRWTIKTDTTANGGIKDLDGQTVLLEDSLYHVAVLFTGSQVQIYLDGQLDAVSNWGGRVLPTTIDLTIAQHFPGNDAYNFRGTLDDIRIYNRALTQEEVWALFATTTSIDEGGESHIPLKSILYQNYPNPFNPTTVIRYSLTVNSSIKLDIYNLAGAKIRHLAGRSGAPAANQPAGEHSVTWDGTNDAGAPVASGVYFYRLEAGSGFVQAKKLVLIR